MMEEKRVRNEERGISKSQCRFLKKNLLKLLDKSTRIRLVLFYTGTVKIIV